MRDDTGTARVVPFPGTRGHSSDGLFRFLPSGRSVILSVALLLGAGLAYLLARETSVFAVRAIDVRGASGAVVEQVESALVDTRGSSLVGLDLGRLTRTVEGIPAVAAVSFDRSFPNTLTVVVTPERAVAVVRQGTSGFLVSRRARVIAAVERGSFPRLARIWVSRSVPIHVGARVPGDLVSAVRAVSPLSGIRFPARVVSVTTSRRDLKLRLRSGVELRLGTPVDVSLKLAVAARVLPLMAEGSRYLDVSAPDRPVAGGAATFDPPAIAPPTPPVPPAPNGGEARAAAPVPNTKAQVEVDTSSPQESQVSG